MKHLLSVFLSLLIILTALSLSSCAEKKPALRDSFVSQLTVSGGALDFSVSLSRSPGTLALTLTSPASVKGLRFAFCGDELTVACGGLSATMNDDPLPPSSFVCLIHQVLSGLDGAAYLSCDSGGDTFTVPTSCGKVQVTLSDGIPVRICGDSLPYTVTTA